MSLPVSLYHFQLKNAKTMDIFRLETVQWENARPTAGPTRARNMSILLISRPDSHHCRNAPGGGGVPKNVCFTSFQYNLIFVVSCVESYRHQARWGYSSRRLLKSCVTFGAASQKKEDGGSIRARAHRHPYGTAGRDDAFLCKTYDCF